MNTANRFKLSVVFSLMLPHLATADETQTDEYMQKWAAFTGYNLSSDAPTSPVSTLLSVTNTALAQQNSLFTLLGALTVNAMNTNTESFAPTGSYSSFLNPFANLTFSKFSQLSQNGSSNTNFTASTLIDQGALVPNLNSIQNDPTSQFIADVLTTPNLTYCLNNDGTAWKTDLYCNNTLNNLLVSINAVGPIPAPNDLYTYTYNQPVIPQLNSANLLGPLQYSTTAQAQTGSSSPPTDSSGKGLQATTQLEDATNFIRYLSVALIKPNDGLNWSDYNEAFNTATDASASVSTVTKAQQSIYNYVTDLRSYTARMSIAMNNLYGMLSSRMPQPAQDGTTTSSALSLFQLATRRLHDPSVDSTKQWITQLDQASSATVNKEIAATMADILYMLYVLHQDNERQLLTSTASLISTTNPPSFVSLNITPDDTSAATADAVSTN